MGNPNQSVFSFSSLQVRNLSDDPSSQVQVVMEGVGRGDLHAFAERRFRVVNKVVAVEAIPAQEQPLGPPRLALRPHQGSDVSRTVARSVDDPEAPVAEEVFAIFEGAHLYPILGSFARWHKFLDWYLALLRVPNARVKGTVVEFWPRVFRPLQGPLAAKDGTVGVVFSRRKYVVPMGMTLENGMSTSR